MVSTEHSETRPALNVRGVSKVYTTRAGASTDALRPTTFTARSGEFISLVGPSGCGKTTLLKICAGLLRPTEGHVGFGTEAERALTPQELGMVFQGPVMLPWRTVLDNVLLPADVLRLDKSTAKQRAKELLAMMRLGDVGSKYPGELSGGMQQRAAISRALIHDPAVIFMDEPFGALDAMTREQLNLQLQDVHMKQGKTILFVTHNIQEAVFLSDRILVMSSGPGRVVADLPVTFSRPRDSNIYLKDEFRELERNIRDLLEDPERSSAESSEAVHAL